MQAWVIAGLAAGIVIPFHINLGGGENVTGSIIYSHFHHVVAKHEWSVGYAGDAVAADGCRGDGRD